MPLIKVENGLIEKENFLLSCTYEDLLGNARYSRTLDKFIFKNGEIKRRFEYSSFVLDIKKEKLDLEEDESIYYYVENIYGKIGLKEIKGIETITDIRIVFYDGFIETYISNDDGLTWDNINGSQFLGERLDFQGFIKNSKQDLIIKEYKVYKEPYVTIKNFNEGTTVRVYKEDKSFYKERIFEANKICKISLDNNFNGYMEFYDEEDNLILDTKVFPITMGDTFLFTPYLLKMIYKEQVLDQKQTTNLNKRKEKLILKNISKDRYENLTMRIRNNSTDNIEISFDDMEYFEELKIKRIDAEEEIKFYIKIQNDNNKELFSIKDFSIDIV